jgi:hypothetical protein
VAVDGLGVAYATGGFVLLYSGFSNRSVKDTLTAFLHGQVPASSPAGAPTVGISDTSTSGTAAENQTTATDNSISAGFGSTTPSTVTSIQNYSLARMIAGTYGWATGTEWAALTEVISRESGGNPDAANPSGAYGIAQALGHAGPGDAGTVSSTAYGGYGVPAATCQAANSGNASAQLIWMMAYIKATYGDPIGAWNSEQERGYY